MASDPERWVAVLADGTRMVLEAHPEASPRGWTLHGAVEGREMVQFATYATARAAIGAALAGMASGCGALPVELLRAGEPPRAELLAERDALAAIVRAAAKFPPRRWTRDGDSVCTVCDCSGECAAGCPVGALLAWAAAHPAGREGR